MGDCWINAEEMLRVGHGLAAKDFCALFEGVIIFNTREGRFPTAEELAEELGTIPRFWGGVAMRPPDVGGLLDRLAGVGAIERLDGGYRLPPRLWSMEEPT